MGRRGEEEEGGGTKGWEWWRGEGGRVEVGRAGQGSGQEASGVETKQGEGGERRRCERGNGEVRLGREGGEVRRDGRRGR